MKTNSYYFDQLNKEQQKVYFAIKEGLSNMDESFPVLRIDSSELSDIFFKVRLDNPKIFYSVSFKYRYYPDSTYIEFIPEYLFQKDKMKEHKSAMDARINNLCKQMASMNDMEKEQYIHDFICTKVHYDKLKKPYSHEILGSLGNGVAVCEGIAKAVKVLCDELNIWCVIAISDNNPEKNIKYRHAWNIIKIEGKYYHLDATFDNTLTKDSTIRYDYYNLSDKQIFRDHEPIMWNIPECEDNDNFYYNKKKLSWTTIEEVRNRTKQAVKKNKTLLFHWRGGYLTKDIFNNLVEVFETAAADKGKTAHIAVNWAQAVFKVTFVEGNREDQIEMEEANEGEAV